MAKYLVIGGIIGFQIGFQKERKLMMSRTRRQNGEGSIFQVSEGKWIANSSVKKVYVALNSCYKHALMVDVVAKNPCLGVVLPAQNERTKQVTPL